MHHVMHVKGCQPKDYQRFGYYEKWLAGLANLLVQHQLVSRNELASGRADKNSPVIEARPLPATKVEAVLKKVGQRAVLLHPPRAFLQVIGCRPETRKTSRASHTAIPACRIMPAENRPYIGLLWGAYPAR